MKFGRWIGFLLVLNLGMVIYLVAVVSGGVRSGGSDKERSQAGDGLREVIVYRTNEVFYMVTNQFHWSDLESEDYPTYIENLRAIGCPEQTIRDIVIADLDLLWSPRIASIYPRRSDLRFWHSEEYELRNNYDQRDFLRLEREVDREKRKVIRELIGVDLVAERARLLGEVDEMERNLSFLDADTRMDVRGVWERFQDEEWQIQEKLFAEGGALSESDQEALRDLRARRDEELAALMTPEQLDMFHLWMSPVAENLRHDLYGMETSEQEFRDLFALKSEFREQWHPDYIDYENPSQLTAWSMAQAELEDRMREVLGDERYLDYQRGQDEDYHLLNSTVSRYDLDRELADEIYNYKAAYESEKQMVIGDPQLNTGQREAALRAIRDATNEEVRQMLGESAYNYFRRRSQWLR